MLAYRRSGSIPAALERAIRTWASTWKYLE